MGFSCDQSENVIIGYLGLCENNMSLKSYGLNDKHWFKTSSWILEWHNMVTHIYNYIYTHTDTRIVHMQIRICMYIYLYVYMCKCVHTHIHTHIWIYIYIHIYIYVYSGCLFSIFRHTYSAPRFSHGNWMSTGTVSSCEHRNWPRTGQGPKHDESGSRSKETWSSNINQR